MIGILFLGQSVGLAYYSHGIVGKEIIHNTKVNDAGGDDALRFPKAYALWMSDSFSAFPIGNKKKNTFVDQILTLL